MTDVLMPGAYLTPDRETVMEELYNELPVDTIQPYIESEWFEPHIAIAPFDKLPHDMITVLLSNLQLRDVRALAGTCHTMTIMFRHALTMVLCDLAFSGELHLTYVTEHKPLIDRVRAYFPEFNPLPCDYEPNYVEEQESYDPEEERILREANYISDSEIDMYPEPPDFDFDNYELYDNYQGLDPDDDFIPPAPEPIFEFTEHPVN